MLLKIHLSPARGTRGRSEYLNSCSKKNSLSRGRDGMRIHDPGKLFKNITSTNIYEHRVVFGANAMPNMGRKKIASYIATEQVGNWFRAPSKLMLETV